MGSPSADPEVARAIFAVLDADAELAGLLSVPHAIFQDFAREGARLPYVIFSLHTGPRTARGMHGSFLREQLWLVKGVCRGKSPTVARKIDFRCEQLLDEVQFPIASGRLLNSQRERDVATAQVDSGEVVYQRGGMYVVTSEP
jgi:hypothetical protein